MSDSFPKVTLIIGGAASGKSKFAERLTRAAGRPLVYVATSQAFDEEMQDKIAQHRAQRGQGWETLEKPFAMPDVLGTVGPEKIVLVDCLTVWLSNFMLAKMPTEELSGLLKSAATAAKAPVVFVTNETGSGVIPESELGRKFRQAQGELNQDVAAWADLVVSVQAGLPLVLKGELPAGIV